MLVYRFRRKVNRQLDLAHRRIVSYNRIVSLDANRKSIPGLSSYTAIPYDREFIGRAAALSGEFVQEPQREIFVCSFTKVDLQVETGALAVSGNKLIAESATESISLQASVRSYVRCPEPIEHLSGATYATIMTHHRNYFHWFTDTLPRLYLLDALKLDTPVKLLVPTNLKLHHLTSLMWCLPANFSVEFVEADRWLTVENLYFPSLVRTRTSNYLPKEALDFVRNAAFRHVPLAPVLKPGRRIYISRSKDARRCVLNEQDVRACLTQFGFEVVYAQELTVEEQVSLFHTAEWIVAPHGAGLTNMLFGEHLRILEFIHDPSPYMYFSRLASILGHEHHYIPAKQKRKDDDMLVDVAGLERKLVELRA